MFVVNVVVFVNSVFFKMKWLDYFCYIRSLFFLGKMEDQKLDFNKLCIIIRGVCYS